MASELVLYRLCESKFADFWITSLDALLVGSSVSLLAPSLPCGTGWSCGREGTLMHLIGGQRRSKGYTAWSHTAIAVLCRSKPTLCPRLYNGSHWVCNATDGSDVETTGPGCYQVLRGL